MSLGFSALGAAAFGDTGTSPDVTVVPSGISLNVTQSSPTVPNVNSTGWGRGNWSDGRWGFALGTLAAVNGISLDIEIGDENAKTDVAIDVTGIPLASSINGVTAFTDVSLVSGSLSGLIQIGNAASQVNIELTAQSFDLSTEINSVTIEAIVNEGWGRSSWSDQVWGDAYSVLATGISLSAIIGNEDAFTDVTVEVSGQEIQSAITPVGTKADSDNEIAHSFLISTILDNVVVEANANVEIPGLSASIEISEVEAGTITEVPVTGITANILTGNVDTTANANVLLTGISTTGFIGDITPVAKYDVTGVSATFDLGALNIIGNALVTPTGIELTSITGLPNIIAWRDVNTGSTASWDTVDTGSSSSWETVNKGTDANWSELDKSKKLLEKAA